MADLPFATCDQDLTEGAPEWVHLMPPGRIRGRDGREFVLDDPQAVIAAFAGNGADLPVDYEHQSDTRPDLRSGPVPAAGWIKELKAGADGLWGRVEWTAQAREMIAGKAYRYLSPSFYYDKASKAVIRLKGAGLVHKPNLHLKALAAEEDLAAGDGGLLKRLAAVLDLPEDAAEEDVFKTLDAMTRLVRDMTRNAATQAAELRELRSMAAMPDPARFVPIDAVQELMAGLGAERTAQRMERAEAKVRAALAKGYITPAMKGWATALCASDEASFDAFVAKAVPHFAGLSQPLLPAAPPERAAAGAVQSDAAAAICAQLGLAPGALKE